MSENKDLIVKKIKEIYGSKNEFSAHNGFSWTNFPRKIKTMENKIKWINNLLSPLELKVVIVEKSRS